MFGEFAIRNAPLQKWAEEVNIKLGGRSASLLDEVMGELPEQYPVGTLLVEMKDIEDEIMSFRARGIDEGEIDDFLAATEAFREGFLRDGLERVKRNPSDVVVPGLSGLFVLVSEDGYEAYLP